MIDYIRLIKELMAQGMKEDKAISLVSRTYGIDHHILHMMFHSEEST